MSLQWCHNECDGMPNHHRCLNCLLNRLFRSKKTSKLRITGLCEGNSPVVVSSPHKGPVMRKMFLFDDVLMYCGVYLQTGMNNKSWAFFILYSGSNDEPSLSLIARFMGPTWGPSEADRTQVGPMLAPWILLSGMTSVVTPSLTNWHVNYYTWNHGGRDRPPTRLGLYTAARLTRHQTSWTL